MLRVGTRLTLVSSNEVVMVTLISMSILTKSYNSTSVRSKSSDERLRILNPLLFTEVNYIVIEGVSVYKKF